MERTISRIKNLKTRRKLSLPASPSPSYSASSIGGAGGGQPSPDGDTATSPCPPLATSPSSVTGGGRMRRGGGAGGPTAARSGSLCVPAPNKRSLESTPKEWSPPQHGQHPPQTRVRQPRRASVCGVGGGGGGVVQHLIRYPMIATAGPPASSPAAPAGAAGRYTRRSDSVSTVEEEEDEMAAVRARVLAGNGQRKSSRAGEMKTEWSPRFESCNTFLMS